jgi:catechol 2,3-dioxygenase-like lactoylglutathione lyase family enzyme
MDIEHFALNVSDPVAMARWYTEHLGMRVVRSIAEPPHTRFLADRSGRGVVEIYGHTKAAVPDYAALDPLVLHLAFSTADVHATRERLLAAGASSVGEVIVTPSGDEMAFLRDPWGVPLQLVRRARPLIE